MRLTVSLALLAIALPMDMASPALAVAREESFLSDWSIAPSRAVPNMATHQYRALSSNHHTTKDYMKHIDDWEVDGKSEEYRSNNRREGGRKATNADGGRISDAQEGSERTIEWKGKPEDEHEHGGGEEDVKQAGDCDSVTRADGISQSGNSPGSFTGGTSSVIAKFWTILTINGL